jgi:hypothetical protein
MEQPSNIVDEHIDDFIQVGRRRWDVGCFIIDRDPIYDIKGSSQAKGVEMSFSEDWPPCMYDSYVWKPSDDMVTNLFFPFDDDLCSMIFIHPLVHTLLRMQIFLMRTSDHCTQFLRNTRTWPPQRIHRFILQSVSIFIMEISMEIQRGRGDVFLHRRFFLTTYPLLQEFMQYSSNLSSPLGPRQEVSLYALMNMRLHLHIVSPFKDGLISLVATLSGGMIRLMVSLSNMISSLPPIFMSFFS